MKLGEPTVNSGPVRWLARANVVGLMIAIFVIGLVAGSVGWHTAVLQKAQDLVTQVATLTDRDPLPTMTLDIDFEDYNVLLAQRETALEKGAYISSSGGFVPAEMRIDGVAVEVDIQLREGPADDLGVDDKWPFEVYVTSTTLPEALPFSQFYLQDPAENNWLMQWAFTEALQREGLLAARYRFVHLTLNGDDRGIYAVQEGFGDSLLLAQGQPSGVIIGFDTNPFWEAIVHFRGNRDAALADPVSNLPGRDFRFYSVDTSYYDLVADNPEIEAQRDEAITLLYALQTGQSEPSQTLDPNTYGRFLALVDLWGASEATSPLNLRYYYNAAAERLLPISINANALGSDERLTLAATYKDPILQMVYVQEATRMSNPAYLEALKADLDPEWQRLSTAVHTELRASVSPWGEIEKRQTLLRRSLNPVEPVLANVATGATSGYDILDIDVANILNVPVEVLGFDIAGATFVDVAEVQVITSTEIIPDLGTGVVLGCTGHDESEKLHYTRFRLSLGAIRGVDEEATFGQNTDISVAVRLLGATEPHLVLAVTEIPQLPSPGANP